MSEHLPNIRSALVKALTEVPSLELPIAYPNTKFDPTGLLIWGACFVMMTDDVSASLGANGEDEVTGYLQVNVKVSPQTGEAKAYQAAEKIRSHFKIGFTQTYAGLHVTVSKRKIGAAGLIDDWFTLPIIIHFYCRVPREDD